MPGLTVTLPCQHCGDPLAVVTIPDVPDEMRDWLRPAIAFANWKFKSQFELRADAHPLTDIAPQDLAAVVEAMHPACSRKFHEWQSAQAAREADRKPMPAWLEKKYHPNGT